MRDPRLTAGSRFGPAAAEPPLAGPPLVAVAHGSKDPRAAATVSELLDEVRAQSPGLDVRAAFLDHCAPALPQVLGALDGRAAVVVPLLLTAAYHSKTDIPAQLAAGHAAADVASAAALGPHPLLLAALERRLAGAGVPVSDAAARAATSVVLAAAGSSDPAARKVIEALAARWARARGWRAVLPAYASADGPRPEQAVAAASRDGGRVAVATYLLAPGYFADKVRDAALAAGADAVSPALGAAPEVARVVLERYAAAAETARQRPATRLWPGQPETARASR